MMTLQGPEHGTTEAKSPLDELVETIQLQLPDQGGMSSYKETKARVARDKSVVYAVAARLAKKGIYISLGEVDRSNGGELIPVNLKVGQQTIFLCNIDCGTAPRLSEGSVRDISEDDFATLIADRMQEEVLLTAE